MLGPFEWLLLNETGKLSEIGWQDGSRSKLWRYNQHYFDDLNANGVLERKSHHKLLIDRWIIENPIGIGHGWEPYPTSLRIINWIKWSIATNALSPGAVENLSLQAKWLSKRLEWHLLGNHLFVNAKALIFAGLFFQGNEADLWLTKGLKILKQQVSEQILSDGGQFELSTMYHALALEDLLDLINILEANNTNISLDFEPQVQNWRSIIPKMLTWLISMSHPDGKISFFNDAAFEIAPSISELLQYAKRLGFDVIEPGVGITDLKQSGYVRLQSRNAVLIADIGRIGPDHLPGHAHADTLSFELSVNGQRIFVNSGTSVYGVSEERLRQRGTLAHNTVSINGQDSSEVWSGFRVGSRVSITSRLMGVKKNVMIASGSHDGYVRKNVDLTHWREFLLDDKLLKIKDEISYSENAEARYYLHPKVSVKKMGLSYGQIEFKSSVIGSWRFSGASHVKIIDTTWHPKFGVNIPNQCIIAHFDSKDCEFILEWS
jgi:uncharacterized heparinase superfamily protein